MNDKDVWFEPKRFGYGSGLPTRWQGWALTAGVIGIGFALGSMHNRRVGISLLLLDIGVFCIISARHTRGGWRWRSGGDA